MLQTPLWGLDVEELTYISLIWVKTKLILLVVVFANPERSCIIHLYFKANTSLLGKKSTQTSKSHLHLWEGDSTMWK